MAGNVSITGYKTVKVDKQPNEISYDHLVTNAIKFEAIDDNLSPIEDIFIEISGTRLETQYINIPVDYLINNIYDDLPLLGEYEVNVRVKDVAGNISNNRRTIYNYMEGPAETKSLTVALGEESTIINYQTDLFIDGRKKVMTIYNDSENYSKIVDANVESMYEALFAVYLFNNSSVSKVKYQVDEGIAAIISIYGTKKILIPPVDPKTSDCSESMVYLACNYSITLKLMVEIDGIIVTQSIDIELVDITPKTAKLIDINYMNIDFGVNFELTEVEFKDFWGNNIENAKVENIIRYGEQVVDEIDTNRLGTYTITTMAVDENGIYSFPLVRNIVIVDNVAPEIDLIGEEYVTVKKGNRYEDQGSLVIDNVDGEIRVYSSDEIDFNKVGKYIISYYYEDSSGNMSEVITRTIIVKYDYTKIVLIGVGIIAILGIGFIFGRKFRINS